MMQTRYKQAIKLFLLLSVTAVMLVGLVASGNRPTWVAASPAIQAKKFTISLPPAIPADLWEMFIPEDNPITEAKVALGRDLYFDKRLSVDNTVSCATCHDPALAFTDGKPVAEGVGGKKGARNSPTILNAMFNVEQFWDGRASSLEEQAKGPLINPLEMAMPSHAAVVAKLQQDADYVRRFREVFGGPITIDNVVKAIAAFERTQLSGDAPFDRFIAGDKQAISPAAQRGWELFKGKARCITCHEFNTSSVFFTDFKYHNIGIGMKATQNFEALTRQIQRMAQQGTLTQEALDKLALTEGFSELGRFLVTRQPRDLGAFKTSPLRDIELTAPYMHDGSLKTLREVIEFYNKGGEPNPNLDGGIIKLNLTDSEISDLEEFLKTLTSDRVRRLARGEEKL
ncbi:MAG: cytochrome c peroxidase [Acidobacteriota bacterium]|nr:cytochrome-c peroxidase [Blastocatellia bacterium]MDW8239953.1 cytochrome c peroxidase [Acidobacteriota bacterium]